MFVLATVGTSLLLGGVALIAATAGPHRYEVAPHKRSYLYIGNDGTLRF